MGKKVIETKKDVNNIRQKKLTTFEWALLKG